MPLLSLADWQAHLQEHPDAHLLQTGEWGELKSAFGWKPLRVMNGNMGAQILFRKLPLGLTIAYMPKPLFSDQPVERQQAFWQEVDRVCLRERAVFLKVEPDRWETPSRYPQERSPATNPSLVVSPQNIQPPRTVLVDLRGGEDEVLSRMKQKCRYNVRLAEKKGVTVRAWNDLDDFHRMMIETGGRDRFGVHSREYYRCAYDLFHPAGMAELLLAEYEGQQLAALMVFVRGKRAWYLFGASTDRERNRMPTYLLQWEAMKWARARGCEEYDLWGVPDEDEETLEAGFEARSDGLWGVYRFKRGFGGRVLRAAQARDRVYNGLLYRIYLWRYSSLRE